MNNNYYIIIMNDLLTTYNKLIPIHSVISNTLRPATIPASQPLTYGNRIIIIIIIIIIRNSVIIHHSEKMNYLASRVRDRVTEKTSKHSKESEWLLFPPTCTMV